MNQKNYFMVISVNVGVDNDKKKLKPQKGGERDMQIVAKSAKREQEI